MEEKEVKFIETGMPGEPNAINATISEQQVINEAFNESIGIWKIC